MYLTTPAGAFLTPAADGAACQQARERCGGDAEQHTISNLNTANQVLRGTVWRLSLLHKLVTLMPHAVVSAYNSSYKLQLGSVEPRDSRT